VNLPNRGKISNLPDEAVVEIPAVVGAAGITGLAVGALPAGIAAILEARTRQQEITVQAALTGDRRLAVQALALDPLVPNPSVAEAVLDAGIAAHGPALERFAEVPVG
jgi:alpha-galactosidase